MSNNIDTRIYCNKCGYKLPADHGFAKLICGPCLDFEEGRENGLSQQYIMHKQARYKLCTKIVELEKEKPILIELAGYAECLFFSQNVNDDDNCRDVPQDSQIFKEEGGWCQVCELKKELKIYPFNK